MEFGLCDGKKAFGATRKPSAEEAVVLQHSSGDLPPHVASQQGLVGTLLASVRLAEGVGNDVGPYVRPNLAPHLSAASHLGAPQAAKHGHIVFRMVSHHV